MKNQRGAGSRRLFGLLAAMLSSTGAVAKPMTFAEALAKAREAPSIASRAAQADAARLTAIASDQLPDPKLEVGIQDYPVTGPNAGSFTRDDFTMEKIGVSQEIPNPAKRRARLGRAVADIGAAQAAVTVEERDVKVQTALAWIDLDFAERRLATLKILDDSIDAISSTVSARLASGSARPAQALEPQQLKAEVGDRRSDLLAEAGRARAALSRWTGDQDPEVTGPPPDWAISPALLRANVDALPSVVAKNGSLPSGGRTRSSPLARGKPIVPASIAKLPNARMWRRWTRS